PTFLVDKVRAGAKVLFEGAQSYMLDVTVGDVPYVTSSNTSVAAAYTGGDLPPIYHRKAFGVAKLIMSRVGNGPFASEFGEERSREYCVKDKGLAHTRKFEEESLNPDELISSDDPFEIGRALRMYSGEYGTGSGRPRRIGMFDLNQLKRAIHANGIDELYLTKADCLVDFNKTKDGSIPIYQGKEESSAVVRVKAPSQPFTEAKSPNDLPEEIFQVIQLIEESCSVAVAGVGVGPHRDQLVSLPQGSPENSRKAVNE
ncbi:MAG: adenylosuccinate synthetase, partial [Bdellovibrionales bacterium]|nr:adenylosuccinate synthetase [Bdellovibrionales bacterium]